MVQCVTLNWISFFGVDSISGDFVVLWFTWLGEPFMKGFLRSRLSLTLAAFIMVSAAIAIPLSNNIIHSHAQGTVTFTEYPIPTSNSLPLGITAGHDGNLWFTEYDTNQIGRITSAGLVTEFPLPTSRGSTTVSEPLPTPPRPHATPSFTPLN